MNREIKFRAWNKKRKEMVPPENIGLLSFERVSPTMEIITIQNDLVELMQYTGLRDKNGKEIYEGDIVFIDGMKEYEYCKPKPKKKDTQGTFFIEAEVGHWGLEFNWRHISGYGCTTHIMGNTVDDGGNVEIIGNIYENPELLTDKHQLTNII